MLRPSFPSSAHRQSLLAARAARLRSAPTSSEALLFEALRGGRGGVRFRRQGPLLGRFIVDFSALAVKVVVEVDDAYHEGRVTLDARRDRALRHAGYHVLWLDAALVRPNVKAAARVRDDIAHVR